MVAKKIIEHVGEGMWFTRKCMEIVLNSSESDMDSPVHVDAKPCSLQAVQTEIH